MVHNPGVAWPKPLFFMGFGGSWMLPILKNQDGQHVSGQITATSAEVIQNGGGSVRKFPSRCA